MAADLLDSWIVVVEDAYRKTPKAELIEEAHNRLEAYQEKAKVEETKEGVIRQLQH